MHGSQVPSLHFSFFHFLGPIFLFWVYVERMDPEWTLGRASRVVQLAEAQIPHQKDAELQDMVAALQVPHLPVMFRCYYYFWASFSLICLSPCCPRPLP